MADSIVVFLVKKKPDDLRPGEAALWRLVYETHEVPAIALSCPWCAHLNWYYSSKPGWFEKNVKVHADGTTYLLRSIICGGCPGHYNVVADPNLERAATSIDIQASRKHLL